MSFQSGIHRDNAQCLQLLIHKTNEAVKLIPSEEEDYGFFTVIKR